MSIFGSIMEKLGMRKHAPTPEVRPFPGQPGGPPQRPAAPGAAPTGPVAAHPQPPAPAAMSDVDVEAKLESLAQASAQKLNWRTSIVDLMKLLGMDSSLAERKELATELGCPPDKMADSAQMNTWLHAAVLRKLAANGGKVPKELLD